MATYRLSGIDALKGIAIVFVLLSHSFSFFNVSIISGGFGVEIFLL